MAGGDFARFNGDYQNLKYRFEHRKQMVISITPPLKVRNKEGKEAAAASETMRKEILQDKQNLYNDFIILRNGIENYLHELNQKKYTEWQAKVANIETMMTSLNDEIQQLSEPLASRVPY